MTHRSNLLARLSGTAAFLVCLCPGIAQDRITVFRGARVVPVAQPAIENGVVVVAAGKIRQVGGTDTAIPDGAEVVDCTGKVITPGLIDAGTTLGLDRRNANEQAAEVTPQVTVLDAIDPTDQRFRKVRANGVTTVQVNPGNANVIGGRGAVLKTQGDTVRQMLVRDECGLRLTMGAEPSSGNRAIRGGTPTSIYYRRPTTRMGVVWEARKAFYDAIAYREQKTVANGDGLPVQDAAMEVLVRALDRKLTVHTTARAEQDIRAALRLAEEFGYETLIEEATEAWRVVQELEAAGVKVLVSAPGSLALPEDARDGAEVRFHTLNLLSAADVPFAIHTGASLGALDLVHEAMFAVRNGLSPERALAAITIVPAKILGIDDRTGSLAAGLDADLVVWSGDPFDPTTRAESVFIAGVRVTP
jgi:imidazolonepropionase-like amidohydrolase